MFTLLHKYFKSAEDFRRLSTQFAYGDYNNISAQENMKTEDRPKSISH